MDSKLPSLPGSDEYSISRNKKDSFYNIGSQEFWANNVIERIEDKPTVKCDHEFIGHEGGVKCAKCHFGLTTKDLEIREGKLFHKLKQLPI